MVGPLDQDARLAAALGRCTGAWSHLEYQFTIIFALLTGLEFGMAAAIFDFFKSTPTQADVLRRISKLSQRPQAGGTFPGELSELLKEYQKLANRRNDLAHNPFGWESQEEKTLYLMIKTKGDTSETGIPWKKRPVTREDIETLTEDIQRFGFTLFVATTLLAGAPPTELLSQPHTSQSDPQERSEEQPPPPESDRG